MNTNSIKTDVQDQMENAAAALRGVMDSSLKQLDARWHDMRKLQKRVKSNPVPFAVAGSGIFLVVAGGIVAAVMESRRRQLPSYRLRKGFQRLMECF